MIRKKIVLDIDKENFNRRKSGYDWDELLKPETVLRNQWLVKIWGDLYRQNEEDEFLRKLSTDDMIKTNWFEKYGVKEQYFKN